MSVGMHYVDFGQTQDGEVAAILADANGRGGDGEPPGSP
jgi:predicted phosphoribosyltransferase